MAREHAWSGGGMQDQGVCMAGACMVGGMHGQGGMCGWGHVWPGGMHGMWSGGHMVGGGHAWWGHTWQERRPLQQTVRILLECILVEVYFNFRNGFKNILLTRNHSHFYNTMHKLDFFNVNKIEF